MEGSPAPLPHSPGSRGPTRIEMQGTFDAGDVFKYGKGALRVCKNRTIPTASNATASSGVVLFSDQRHRAGGRSAVRVVRLVGLNCVVGRALAVPRLDLRRSSKPLERGLGGQGLQNKGQEDTRLQSCRCSEVGNLHTLPHRDALLPGRIVTEVSLDPLPPK